MTPVAFMHLFPEVVAQTAASGGTALTFGVAPVATFGHAGNGHPHQHFHARTGDELVTVERAVEATLRHVISMGGTVAAEHGIGKLKRKWLALQLSEVQLAVMRAVKRELLRVDAIHAGSLRKPDGEAPESVGRGPRERAAPAHLPMAGRSALRARGRREERPLAQLYVLGREVPIAGHLGRLAELHDRLPRARRAVGVDHQPRVVGEHGAGVEPLCQK